MIRTHVLCSTAITAALLAPWTVRAQTAPAPADARISSFEGQVDVTAAAPGSRAQPAATDVALPPGTVVTTHHDAEATIRYSTAGELQVEGDSHVLMFGPSFTPQRGTGAVHDTSISRGSMRVVVNPGATVVVFTPGGHVSMTRGEFRLHVDSARATRVVAYRGRARVLGPDRGFFLVQGTGTRVDEGRAGVAAFPPAQVPRSPVWTQPFPGASIAQGGTASVEARFASPPSQRHAPHGWVIELARDDRFDDVVFERTLRPEDTTFRAERLAEGEYFARVSSVDGERLESLPSATQRFRVIAPRVIPGTSTRRAEVFVPPGIYCRLDGEINLVQGELHSLLPGRRHELMCSGAQDMANPSRIEIPAEQAGELVREVQAVGAGWSPAGGTFTVEMRLRDASGRPYPYANISARANTGVAVSAVRESAERGIYILDVTTPAGTPAVVDFVINDAVRFTERYGAVATR